MLKNSNNTRCVVVCLDPLFVLPIFLHSCVYFHSSLRPFRIFRPFIQQQFNMSSSLPMSYLCLHTHTHTCEYYYNMFSLWHEKKMPFIVNTLHALPPYKLIVMWMVWNVELISLCVCVGKTIYLSRECFNVNNTYRCS